MGVFPFLTTLLGLALDAEPVEQACGSFTLELDQWLCHVTLARAYVCLWNDGTWEVYSHGHIPNDMEGFFGYPQKCVGWGSIFTRYARLVKIAKVRGIDTG